MTISLDKIRNLVKNDDNSLDCELNTEAYGWIPYTIRDNTGEDQTQKLWDIIENKDTIPHKTFTISVDMVKAEGARRLKKSTDEYTEEEIDTWFVQVTEADKVIAGGSSDFLSKLAEARSITVEQMANVVKQKQTLFMDTVSLILASQKKLELSDPIPSDYTNDKHWKE